MDLYRTATHANTLPWPQLVCGSVLVLSLGSPIVQTLVVSSFSTILGSKPQGSNLFLRLITTIRS
jgi:hypothetical protein